MEAAGAAGAEGAAEPIAVGVGVHAGESVATTEGYVGAAVDLVTVDGSGLRRHTVADGGFHERRAFSPDGTRLAFLLTGDGDDATLGVDCRRPRRVGIVRLEPSTLSWSPHGAALAFTGAPWDEQGYRPYIVDAAGGEPRIAGRDQRGSHPVWSPDGRTIAFVVHDGETSEIVYVDAATDGVVHRRAERCGDQRAVVGGDRVR